MTKGWGRVDLGFLTKKIKLKKKKNVVAESVFTKIQNLLIYIGILIICNPNFKVLNVVMN